MLEIIAFAVLGILAGVLFGLVPGIHPNMIVLTVPFLLSLSVDPISLVAFVAALGVSNVVVDFIPSIYLAAPDSGTELAVAPGHRMLARGLGDEAVRLAVTGSLLSMLLLVALIPALYFIVPAVFEAARSFIYLFLLFVVLYMVLTEDGVKKIYASAVFLASGAIGVSLSRFPVDSALILFPVLSGFFGVSTILLQMRAQTEIPKQTRAKSFFSGRLRNRSVVLGTAGGILSGFLPGVGSSEIAAMASVDKNDRSFLVTMGALVTTNAIFSILTLWLISRSRSGVAVAIEQIAVIGQQEFVLIIAVSVLSVAVSSIATIRLSRHLSQRLHKVRPFRMGLSVVIFVVVAVAVFSGVVGLLLLFACTGLGITASMLGIKRGNLMGVLILPTLLFYAFL